MSASCSAYNEFNMPRAASCARFFWAVAAAEAGFAFGRNRFFECQSNQVAKWRDADQTDSVDACIRWPGRSGRRLPWGGTRSADHAFLRITHCHKDRAEDCVDKDKPPVIIVDPRAGHGPGIAWPRAIPKWRWRCMRGTQPISSSFFLCRAKARHWLTCCTR